MSFIRNSSIWILKLSISLIFITSLLRSWSFCRVATLISSSSLFRISTFLFVVWQSCTPVWFSSACPLLGFFESQFWHRFGRLVSPSITIIIYDQNLTDVHFKNNFKLVFQFFNIENDLSIQCEFGLVFLYIIRTRTNLMWLQRAEN